jgi:hypothetical protein
MCLLVEVICSRALSKEVGLQGSRVKSRWQTWSLVKTLTQFSTSGGAIVIKVHGQQLALGTSGRALILPPCQTFKKSGVISKQVSSFLSVSLPCCRGAIRTHLK